MVMQSRGMVHVSVLVPAAVYRQIVDQALRDKVDVNAVIKAVLEAAAKAFDPSGTVSMEPAAPPPMACIMPKQLDILLALDAGGGLTCAELETFLNATTPTTKKWLKPLLVRDLVSVDFIRPTGGRPAGVYSITEAGRTALMAEMG